MSGSGPPGPPDAPTAVYERITDAVFALDDEWRFTYLNERAADLLERREAEILGEKVWTAFPDAVDSTFQREYEHAMESQEPVTFEAAYPPLAARFEVRAYPSESGLTVYFRDVTERVERERRLEKRERALRDAYEVIATSEGLVSAQIEALLGVVRETVGMDYATLSRVDEATDEYVFEAVDAPADADLEAGDTTSLRATNCERVVGTERTLVLEDVEADAPELADRAGNAEWGISCYIGAPVVVDGEVYGTFCFYDMEARAEEFTDWEVTFVDLLSGWVSSTLERERRERDLERSNERLEQFAYAASHDLQEPLRMISSYLSLVDERYGNDLDEEGKEFLEYAVEGADRMSEMVTGLLQYAPVETRGDPFEPVDLEDVLAEVRRDLAVRIEETEADVTAGSLPTVEGDRAQLRQVFQNLVENAVEYSGDDPPRVHVDAERAGDDWLVSVADDGVGIDPEHTDAVFEVFQQLHSREEHGGTGLGLALCERIVERHGGDIWVGSEPGEGATFYLTLPPAAGAALELAGTRRARRVPRRREDAPGSAVGVPHRLLEDAVRVQDDVDEYEWLLGVEHPHRERRVGALRLGGPVDEQLQRLGAVAELAEEVAAARLVGERVDDAVGLVVGAVGHPGVHRLAVGTGSLEALFGGLEYRFVGFDELEGRLRLDGQGVDDRRLAVPRDGRPDAVAGLHLRRQFSRDVGRLRGLDVDEEPLAVVPARQDAEPPLRRRRRPRRCRRLRCLVGHGPATPRAYVSSTIAAPAVAPVRTATSGGPCGRRFRR
jgi:signal transduction histidine kinase